MTLRDELISSVKLHFCSFLYFRQGESLELFVDPEQSDLPLSDMIQIPISSPVASLPTTIVFPDQTQKLQVHFLLPCGYMQFRSDFVSFLVIPQYAVTMDLHTVSGYTAYTHNRTEMQKILYKNRAEI